LKGDVITVKPEDSILQQVHEFMSTPIEEICKPLEGFEHSVVDGYLQVCWHCDQHKISTKNKQNMK
jgi:hypothetical protein